MKVEVCIQDTFNPADDSEPVQSSTDLPPEPSSIAPDASVPVSHLSTATWECWFQRWLEVLDPELSPSNAYELTLRLTDDAEIQALNAQFRQQNQPTDVLAFSSLEVDFPELDEMQELLPLYLGDIIISVETASRQAKGQRHSLEVELAWLATHGLLHLLGWDHPDDESLAQMLQQQERLLISTNLIAQESTGSLQP
jgi:probable rRNA maturation factor